MKYIGSYLKIMKNLSKFILKPNKYDSKKNMRIGKFFANCAKNKKIHSAGNRNRYTAAFTSRNRNRVSITTIAIAFQNLACSRRVAEISDTVIMVP